MGKLHIRDPRKGNAFVKDATKNQKRTQADADTGIEGADVKREDKLIEQGCRYLREAETGGGMTDDQCQSLAKKYAVEYWGKDYSHIMLADDPVFARELRNLKELEDIIRWLRPHLAKLDKTGGAS